MTARPDPPTLLEALDAFLSEHRRCGELDEGVDGKRVWMVCAGCGARIIRRSHDSPLRHGYGYGFSRFHLARPLHLREGVRRRSKTRADLPTAIRLLDARSSFLLGGRFGS